MLTQYIDVSSSIVPTASLDFVAFDKPFDRLHVYNHFDYLVKEAIFERRVRTHWDSCCFINWNCVDIYAVPPLIHLGLFASVADWCRGYECS